MKKNVFVFGLMALLAAFPDYVYAKQNHKRKEIKLTCGCKINNDTETIRECGICGGLLYMEFVRSVGPTGRDSHNLWNYKCNGCNPPHEHRNFSDEFNYVPANGSIDKHFCNEKNCLWKSEIRDLEGNRTIIFSNHCPKKKSFVLRIPNRRLESDEIEYGKSWTPNVKFAKDEKVVTRVITLHSNRQNHSK